MLSTRRTKPTTTHLPTHDLNIPTTLIPLVASTLTSTAYNIALTQETILSETGYGLPYRVLSSIASLSDINLALILPRGTNTPPPHLPPFTPIPSFSPHSSSSTSTPETILMPLYRNDSMLLRGAYMLIRNCLSSGSGVAAIRREVRHVHGGNVSVAVVLDVADQENLFPGVGEPDDIGDPPGSAKRNKKGKKKELVVEGPIPDITSLTTNDDDESSSSTDGSDEGDPTPEDWARAAEIGKMKREKMKEAWWKGREDGTETTTMTTR